MGLGEVDMEKSECLTYPFPPGSEIWHMIESTSQDCYTMDGCGECDTCYWCEEDPTSHGHRLSSSPPPKGVGAFLCLRAARSGAMIGPVRPRRVETLIRPGRTGELSRAQPGPANLGMSSQTWFHPTGKTGPANRTGEAARRVQVSS